MPRTARTASRDDPVLGVSHAPSVETLKYNMDKYSIPIDTSAIRDLVSHAGDPCVSIYLSLEEDGTGSTPAERLESMLGMAMRLLSSRGLSEKQAEKLLKSISRLTSLASFGKNAPGMGLFASPGYSARFILGSAPMEQVSVKTVFHIRPLLERVDEEEVLAEETNSRLAALQERIDPEAEAAPEDIALELQDVLDAAQNGEVELLFISRDCRISGTGKGLNDEMRLNFAGVDMANQAAIWTIENGGEVLMTAPDALGTGTKMLAELRCAQKV